MMQLNLCQFLLSNYLFGALVLARPTSLPVLHLNGTSTQASNGRLLRSPNPGGPAEFDINAIHGYKPLRREACYVSAVRLLALESILDFEGFLPMERTSYDSPQYQDLSIEVSSTRLHQRMPRKYLLWGIARIMHKMTIEGVFVDSWYELAWQGSFVGEILFVAVPRSTQVGIDRSGTSPAHPTMTRTTDTGRLDMNHRLSFKFTLIQEQLLTAENVFMATIGALIQLAESPYQTYNRFAGDFPGEPGVFPTYDAQIYWTNVYLQEPLPLTKAFLAESMLAAVMYGLGMRDFHALGVLVIDDGKQVARGGYLSTRLPPPGHTQNAFNFS